MTYDDYEYVMFADTLAVYPVQKDVEWFAIPVVSSVVRDYDRVFGVEIIDKGNNAIENLHYSLKSNTVTIKAGKLKVKTTAYVVTLGSNMSFLFDADKILSVVKSITGVASGLNASASTVNKLLEEFDGMMVGFELEKQ